MKIMTNYETLTPIEKVQKLEHAVINSSPEEIARVYAKVGVLGLTLRILEIAFRFRGFECIKALVDDGGLKISGLRYMVGGFIECNYDYSVMLLDNFTNLRPFSDNPCDSVTREDGTVLMALPFENRAETVRYLCENKEKAEFIPGNLLFYSILCKDEQMTAELKKLGVELTEYRRKLLTDKGNPDDMRVWISILKRLSVTNFAAVLSRLSEELGGKKFHNTQRIYEAISDKLHFPENLKFYLENFDTPTPNKTKIMQAMIDKSSTGGLAFAESLGWLKQPRKRDEMIEYAVERKSAECAAWLLDFKNRTADLAAERAKAEKKQERELNAAPNSAAVLKTLWSYKKREDGTIIINGYKGDRTEFEVPANIGKSPVTAIKSGAFCPYQGGVIKKTNGRFLKTITEITLPESVVEIGEEAFRYIDNLTVKAPRGSYAEKYCKENKINYVPKGE